MARDRDDFRFWGAVAVRLLGIVLVGGLVIVWFRGCLVPMTRDELRQEQEKAFKAGGPR
jgi:hypothetical protein